MLAQETFEMGVQIWEKQLVQIVSVLFDVILGKLCHQPKMEVNPIIFVVLRAFKSDILNYSMVTFLSRNNVLVTLVKISLSAVFIVTFSLVKVVEWNEVKSMNNPEYLRHCFWKIQVVVEFFCIIFYMLQAPQTKLIPNIGMVAEMSATAFQ